MNDYIFCPFCADSQWQTARLRKSVDGHTLTVNLCMGCNKFGYSTTELGLYEVEAKIFPYQVIVNYRLNTTDIYKMDNIKGPVLSLKQLINFNWYNPEIVLEKVQKYVVFS